VDDFGKPCFRVVKAPNWWEIPARMFMPIGVMACGGAITSKDGSMLGKDGTKTNGSKTIVNVDGNIRVDIENLDPGVAPGNVHVQVKNGSKAGKYYYDPVSEKLMVKTDKGFEEAPNNIQKLLEDNNIQKAIDKGLKTYLGEK